MPTIMIPSGAKFFPTKEFKTGQTIIIKKYVGHVETKFKYDATAIAKNPSLADKFKSTNRFMVEYNGQEYQLDMNGASLKLIGAQWGNQSEAWEGKQCIGEVLRMPTGGNMIEFKPVLSVEEAWK